MRGPRAVVVLGKRLLNDGSASDSLATRMATACNVFRTLCDDVAGDVMIVTGGKPSPNLPRTEAEVMRDLALGRELGQKVTLPINGVPVHCHFGGIKENQIILEDKARTTVENAFLIRERLECMGISEMILITCDFHMRRAHFIFQHVLSLALSANDMAGLETVLEPTLNGRRLELQVGVVAPCVVRTVPNRCPLPEDVRQAEEAFEATLPNEKMQAIIEQVLSGETETIGSNKADKLHKSASAWLLVRNVMKAAMAFADAPVRWRAPLRAAARGARSASH